MQYFTFLPREKNIALKNGFRFTGINSRGDLAWIRVYGGSLKVVLLSNVFSKNMGYLENMLPKYLAIKGVEVHVIAMDLPPYHGNKEIGKTYSGFADPLPPDEVIQIDGFTLHVLGHKKVAGYMRMRGLWEKLKSLRPDIVQTTDSIGWIALDSAIYKIFLKYKLFTANHTHASVFPLANKKKSWLDLEFVKCMLFRALPGRFVSFLSTKCYAIAPDCADIAVKFFGTSKSKVEVSPLGVDTQIFNPISNQDDFLKRNELREQLGFKEDEIVCIYSGRFSHDKNPLLLASAISHLVDQGLPYRGLFVGNGVQGESIRLSKGCVIHPFVPVSELKRFFHASDIGIWPTQESMSMMDAAACGLPIIINDTIVAAERIDGNGFKYKLNDLNDMIRVLLKLKDSQIRKQMGVLSAQNMAQNFSWASVTKRRIHDYQTALYPSNQVGKEPQTTTSQT